MTPVRRFRIAVTAAAVTLAALAQGAPPRDPDVIAGHDALKAGNIQEAKTRFEAAVKRTPSDNAALIYYVSALPAKDALRVMDSLSKAQNASGWAKARGLKFLGDHQFIKEDYKKAADFYMRASALDSVSTYRYLYALSAAMAGQHAQAAQVLGAIAGDKSDPASAAAAQLLAQLQLDHTSSADTRPHDKIPAQVMEASVEVMKGGDNTMTVPVKQTATANTSDKTSSPSLQNIIFTIQVGAFGSRENAENLVKRLSGTHKDITVSPSSSGDQTLYRVRVGTFHNREDAAAFADKLVTEGGMSARVVEK